MNVSDLRLGDTVDFSLHLNSALPIKYEGSKVLAILDVDTARLWIDPIALHQSIYPSLPEGTVNDPESYGYIKLKLINGDITVIGMPWINESTLSLTGRNTVLIPVEDISPDDIPNIVKALVANGYTVGEPELQ